MVLVEGILLHIEKENDDGVNDANEDEPKWVKVSNWRMDEEEEQKRKWMVLIEGVPLHKPRENNHSNDVEN